MSSPLRGEATGPTNATRWLRKGKLAATRAAKITSQMAPVCDTDASGRQGADDGVSAQRHQTAWQPTQHQHQCAVQSQTNRTSSGADTLVAVSGASKYITFTTRR